MEVIFLVGLPGSGKSTVASIDPTYKVVSMDRIRQDMGIIGSDGKKGIGNNEQEAVVKAKENETIADWAKAGYDFIIDDTNLKSGKRMMQIDIIKKANQNYKIKYILVKTPVEICISRRPEIPQDIMHSFNDASNWVIYKEELQQIDALEVISNN
jgi:predicted kinase